MIEIGRSPKVIFSSGMQVQQQIRYITLGDPARGLTLGNDVILKSDQKYAVISLRRGEVTLLPEGGGIAMKLFYYHKLPRGWALLQLGKEAQPISVKLPNIPFLLKLLSP